MSNPELDEARAQYEKARLRVKNLIEEEYARVGRPLLKKLVGKCYKFSNTYGVGDDMRRWPLYARIVGFDEKDMSFESVEFQLTTRNNIEIRFRKRDNFDCRSHYSLSTGWVEISLKEYDRARRTLLRRVEALLLLERRPKR